MTEKKINRSEQQPICLDAVIEPWAPVSNNVNRLSCESGSQSLEDCAFVYISGHSYRLHIFSLQIVQLHNTLKQAEFWLVSLFAEFDAVLAKENSMMISSPIATNAKKAIRDVGKAIGEINKVRSEDEAGGLIKTRQGIARYTAIIGESLEKEKIIDKIVHVETDPISNCRKELKRFQSVLQDQTDAIYDELVKILKKQTRFYENILKSEVESEEPLIVKNVMLENTRNHIEETGFYKKSREQKLPAE